MNLLKRICLTLVGLAKQACVFPPSVGMARTQKRQRFGVNEVEAERLDRLRNPSKYRGK